MSNFWAAHGGLWSIHAPALDKLRAKAAAVDKLLAVDGQIWEPEEPPEASPGDLPPEPPGYFLHPSGVAILNIHGEAMAHATPYATALAYLFGGCCYDWLQAGLQRALADPAVSGIVLSVDSPGGQVDGAFETADLIRSAAKTKRVAAYVSGSGTSAAYLLASAAPWVVAHKSSILGSLGVLLYAYDDTEALKKEGLVEYEYVSVQSPKKGARPGTAEGDAEYKELVDSMADILLEAVAGYRGTTPLRVMEDFGQGGVLVGSEALKVGMIDELGTFEGVLAKVAAGSTRTRVQMARPMRAVASARAHLLTARRP
jgi:ClpP class serine protease